MATTYIGPGEAYVDLSTWETFYDGVGGPQTAILTADIVDNVAFGGWATGSSDQTVTVMGNLAGNTKRRLTSDGDAGHLIYAASGGLDHLIVKDLLMDCGAQASGKDGIHCATGFGTLTMERVTIKDAKQYGMYVSNSSAYTAGIIDNCIFDGNAVAVGLLKTELNTTTFNNCLFTGTTSSNTHLLAANDNQWAYFRNCVSFDNAGDDFDNAEKTSRSYVYNCVSEDSSANDAKHTAFSGNAIAQTLLSTYFRNEASDFRLLQDDFDNWGINGESVYTPALDYQSAARSSNDIGPYDFHSERRKPQRVARRIARRIDHR